MKKIVGLMVILVVLGTVVAHADPKDDWSFELAKVASDIREGVNWVEGHGSFLSKDRFDKSMQEYMRLLEVGFNSGYLTREEYNQKIEALNAIKRRLLQVISEGLGL
jgi:hypothetical protein